MKCEIGQNQRQACGTMPEASQLTAIDPLINNFGHGRLTSTYPPDYTIIHFISFYFLHKDISKEFLILT